jgi:hypothetical protein
MLLCGAEEPLGSNQQLYALEESTGALALADFSVTDANRYSLLWVGPREEAPARLSAVLGAIFLHLSLPGAWCAAWSQGSSDELAGQTRTKRWRHGKDGFDIHDADDLAIAVAGVSAESLSWPPADRGARTVLLLGEGITADRLGHDAPLPSMKALARSGMAPSHEIISWLVEQRWSMVYPNRDDLGRLGVIIVGAHRIPVGTLESDGLIQETKWNEAASLVWRTSPTPEAR